MASRDDSSQWTKSQVVKQLRARGSDKPVAAQVFLKDDIAAEDLSTAVEKIVSGAEKRAGSKGLKVGKIHQLAKSFSVVADAEAVAAIAEEPSVKNILPSEIDDIYPKPVKVKKV